MAENEKKAQKSEKKSKPGFFAKVSRWLRELKSELKKVQWPTGKQTMNNTVIVISCVAVVGAFIWVFDFVAEWGITKLLDMVHH